MNQDISSKVTAATLGSAVATLIWLLAGMFNIVPPDTSPGTVAAATGATATIFTFSFGYVIRDSAHSEQL
jgi:hypothetical protein